MLANSLTNRDTEKQLSFDSLNQRENRPSGRFGKSRPSVDLPRKTEVKKATNQQSSWFWLFYCLQWDAEFWKVEDRPAIDLRGAGCPVPACLSGGNPG